MVSATEICCTLSFGVHLWKPEKNLTPTTFYKKIIFKKNLKEQLYC